MEALRPIVLVSSYRNYRQSHNLVCNASKFSSFNLTASNQIWCIL